MTNNLSDKHHPSRDKPPKLEANQVLLEGYLYTVHGNGRVEVWVDTGERYEQLVTQCPGTVIALYNTLHVAPDDVA